MTRFCRAEHPYWLVLWVVKERGRKGLRGEWNFVCVCVFGGGFEGGVRGMSKPILSLPAHILCFPEQPVSLPKELRGQAVCLPLPLVIPLAPSFSCSAVPVIKSSPPSVPTFLQAWSNHKQTCIPLSLFLAPHRVSGRVLYYLERAESTQLILGPCWLFWNINWIREIINLIREAIVNGLYCSVCLVCTFIKD